MHTVPKLCPPRCHNRGIVGDFNFLRETQDHKDLVGCYTNHKSKGVHSFSVNSHRMSFHRSHQWRSWVSMVVIKKQGQYEHI